MYNRRQDKTCQISLWKNWFWFWKWRMRQSVFTLITVIASIWIVEGKNMSKSFAQMKIVKSTSVLKKERDILNYANTFLPTSWSPYDGPKSFLLGRAESIPLQRTWKSLTSTGALALSMDQVHHIAKGLKSFLLGRAESTPLQRTWKSQLKPFHYQ